MEVETAAIAEALDDHWRDYDAPAEKKAQTERKKKATVGFDPTRR
jgi:hypothetical protein